MLSGSANFGLLRGVSESLAGRAVYYNLRPFSRRELAGSIDRPPFLVSFMEKPQLPRRKSFSTITDMEVLTGGLPPIALGEVKESALWFKGYEQTYLERDLRDIAAVENMLGFRDLLKLAALRTSQLLNASELGRDAKLEAKTASRYVGWMEASFIIHRLPPYRRNKASRIIKSPKIYITDSGLASYLCGCRDLADDPLRGSLYETYVLQNLLAAMETLITPVGVYFWRTHTGQEVDFVLEYGREVMAVEVKSGANFGKRDLSGLQAFLAATPHCKVALLAYNGTEAMKLGERLWAIPLGLMLS